MGKGNEALTPEVGALLKKMEQVCHDLAWNRYDRVGELFELTKQKEYPEQIARLAESFGMMLVKVEAREYHMEEVLVELRQANKELEESRKRLKDENAGLKKGLMDRYSSKRIVAQSAMMRDILSRIERIADTPVNVLITGETGTGKELVAKALHYNSFRKTAPFVAMNCSAIPETLFESELFGIEKGVATGVTKRKGLMEQADGGTLLLDEVADMSMASQAKILRVLEERELVRVGGSKSISVDIRVLAAANVDLQAMVEAGDFRKDLYYRLNVVSINIPPLRKRPDDIPLLVKKFLAVHCRSMGRPIMKVRPEAMDALMHYSWPGNVRELENEVERLVALSYSSEIRLEDLSPWIAGHESLGSEMPQTICDANQPLGIDKAESDLGLNGFSSLAEHEKKLIQRALEATDGNKTQAAEMLGISREGLRKKIKRLFPG
ncbi:MAG: sigma-54 interaction domain-containing protein [Desulfonatronovibrionaceae bacterium]